MKKLLKRILLVSAIIGFFLISIGAYSYFIEPDRLVVHREDLRIPNWNAKLNGFKVVAVSDIHGGSNSITEKKIRDLVELINEQNEKWYG